MIRTYKVASREVLREMFPNAAIIRILPDRSIVFDTTADAHMHETAQLQEVRSNA